MCRNHMACSRTSTTWSRCIGASQLPGPFVFAAHSYGGLVLDLLARTHPDLVAGLVMVDPVSEFLRDGG